MNKRWFLFSKSFSSGRMLGIQLQRLFPVKNLQFDSVCFLVSGASLEHVVLLDPLVELGTSSRYEIMEFLVLAGQLDGPEDNLLVGPFFLLDYPDVVCLSPGRSTCLCVVEQLCYSVRIQPGLDPAQSIGHLVIGAFEVSDGHVVAGQGGNPTVAQCIKIWCRKNISEGIVVHQHSECLYCRYSRNCSVMAHLRARNSNLDEWYLASPLLAHDFQKQQGATCHPAASGRVLHLVLQMTRRSLVEIPSRSPQSQYGCRHTAPFEAFRMHPGHPGVGDDLRLQLAGFPF